MFSKIGIYLTFFGILALKKQVAFNCSQDLTIPDYVTCPRLKNINSMSRSTPVGIFCHSIINFLCLESYGSVENNIRRINAFCSRPLPSISTKSGLGYFIKNEIKDTCDDYVLKKMQLAYPHKRFVRFA